MLLQFSCENHKSIKEKITFSAVAGKDTAHADKLKNFDSFKVLRMAAIYGANGSGKSNFISAIAFAKALVTNSINHQPGEKVFQAPHKLSAKDKSSSYDFQFITKGVRYAYGFSIKENIVDEEYLYYFPKNRQVKIFERDGMTVIPGDRYKKAFDLSLNVLKENRLLLSCAANFSNVQEIENAFLFFKDEIVIYDAEINNWAVYSAQLMNDNPDIKRIFVDILHVLDSDIRDVKVKIEKKKFETSELPTEMPPFFKEMITSQETNVLNTKIVYDVFETDLMNEESSGVQKLFEIICPIIDILINGKILIFDEIENGLHESIVRKIVEMFRDVNLEEFAQLFFTTHDTSLLDTELFRRDQVWFTELNGERATELYSLAEIRNVRKGENIAKGYINGRYGKIPMLNRSFTSAFEI